MQFELTKLADDCQHSGLFPSPGGGKLIVAGDFLYAVYGNSNGGSSILRCAGGRWVRGAELPIYPPYLAVDSRGFLHIAGLHAGNRAHVWYFRSQRPHDARIFGEPQPIHVKNYSSLAVDTRDDSLYYFGAGVHVRGIAFRRGTAEGTWSGRTVIGTGRIIYPGVVIRDGVLHLMFCGWSDSAAVYENVYYLRSADRGETWSRHDGKPIPIPFDYDPMDPATDRVLGRVSMNFHEGEARSNTHNLQLFVDRKGRPHVFHYFAPAYFPRPRSFPRNSVAHARGDPGGWRHSLVSTDPNIAIWMASAAEDEDGTLHCICTFRRSGRRCFDLGYTRSKDAGEVWSPIEAVTSDADRLNRNYMYPQWAASPYRGQLCFICSVSGTPGPVFLGRMPAAGRPS